MANRIEFEVGVNPSGFRRGVAELEQLAGVAGGRMAGSMDAGFLSHGGPGGGISGTIRESLVLLREAGRGNYTRMAGSATLLTQYLGGLNLLYKNTASSAVRAAIADEQLAEKMNLMALVARKEYESETALIEASNFATASQMAEVESLRLKAIAAEEAAIAQGKNAEATALSARVAQASATTSITALGWLAAALLVVGVAAYVVIRHFYNLAEAHKEYADAVDASRKTFAEEVKAKDELAKSDAELNRWLEKELSNRKDLMDLTRQRIDQLHKETEAQTELMRARGMSAVQIAAYNKSQLEQEQRLLEAAQAQAQANLKNAEGNLSAARAARDTLATGGVNIGGTSYTQTGLEKARTTNAAIIDAIVEYNKSHRITEFNGPQIAGPHGMLINSATSRERTADDVATVSKGAIPGLTKDLSVSLSDALKTQKELDAKYKTVIDTTDKVADSLEQAKQDIQVYGQNSRQVANDLANVRAELGVSGTNAQAAALEAARRRKGTDDSLIKTGNFLGINKATIESTQMRQLSYLQKIEGHLQNINNKMSSSVGGEFSF